MPVQYAQYPRLRDVHSARGCHCDAQFQFDLSTHARHTSAAEPRSEVDLASKYCSHLNPNMRRERDCALRGPVLARRRAMKRRRVFAAAATDAATQNRTRALSILLILKNNEELRSG